MTARRGRLGLVLGALLVVGACGEGDDVPLNAPGVTGEWPADGRWQPVGNIFHGYTLRDAAWDRTAADDTQRVLLITDDVDVFVHEQGAWRREISGLDPAPDRVVALGADAFLATGPGGLAATRSGGVWRREDAATNADFHAVAVREGVAWLVGAGGTVRRRADGAWSVVPAPDARDLAGVAVLADSVFVAVAGSDSLRVWAGPGWSVLSPGPWSGHALRGVHALADGRLVVAADSLYGRTSEGWRGLDRDIAAGTIRVDFKSAGATLWYREHGDPAASGSWSGLIWDGPPVTVGRAYGTVVAARSEAAVMTAFARGEVLWDFGSVRTYDPAGRISLFAAFPVGGDGLVVAGGEALYWQRGRERRMLLPWDELPDFRSWRFAGAGAAADDFWLVDAPGLYHVVGGVPERIAEAPSASGDYGLAVDGAGVPHVLADGVWRWQGSWERILPHGGASEPYGAIWPLGDGRLATRSNSGDVAVIADGRAMTLREVRQTEPLLASGDGRLILVDRVATDFETSENTLLVWDDRAGAFRDLGNAAMGPLARLSVAGWAGLPDLPLVWTRNPTMIFTLAGAPEATDWRLVAGAVSWRIEALARLHDGSLLVLDTSEESLHLYRP